MGSGFKGDDFFEKGALNDIDKATEKLIKNFAKLVELQKESLKLSQQRTESNALKTSKDFAKLNTEQEKVIKSSKELKTARESQAKLEEKLAFLTSKAGKAQAQLRLEIQKETKAVKDNLKENSKLSTEYEKQSAKLNRLRKELKNLILTEGEGSEKTKKLAKEVQILDQRLKRADAAAGQFQRNVGNYPKFLGSATRALTSFIGAFGLVAGVQGFVSIFKDAIKVNREFNKSLSSLSSITGATGKDLEFFKEQARLIGATTTLSSTQAVTAFKLIGSAKPELLESASALAEVTKEAVILAEAAEIDLTVAATAVTTSLNQMGASADQTSRFVNVLAAGSKAGAADIPFLNAAIEKSGAVARDANLSFEQLVAGIETIAPSVSEPSSAGLKFADILLRLQKAGKGFESGQFDLKDALTQVKAEFEAIEDPVKKAQVESELFGKTSIVVGKVLLQNIDTFEDFTTAVTGTSVALEQQAINVNNLDGDVKSFNSTIEAIQLQLTGGGGFIRAITQTTTELLRLVFGIEEAGANLDDTQKATRETANNILDLGKALIAIVAGFLAYKTAIIASSVATKAASAIQAAYSTVTSIITGKIKLATLATRAFNLATKSNIIVAVATAVLAAAAAFGLFSDSVDEAADALDENFNKRLDETRQKITELNTAMLGARERARLLRDAFRDALSGFTADELQNTLKLAEDALAESIRGRNRARSAGELSAKIEIQARRTTIENLITEIKLRKSLVKETDEEAKKRKKSEKEREKKAKKEADDRRKFEQDQVNDARAKAATINQIEQAQFEALIQAKERELEIESLSKDQKLLLLDEEFELRRNKLVAQADFELNLDTTTAEQKELIGVNLNTSLTALDADRLDSVKKINDEELALEEEKAKAIKDARDKQAKELQENLDKVIDAIQEFITKANEARLKSLDEQIQASEGNITRLEALAAQGAEGATENLANEVQRQAELEQERKKQIEEQKTLELTLAALQTFSANVQAGDGNALGSTIGSITALLGFIGSLGSFKEGTTDTGTVGKPLDADGGRLAIHHDNERIMDKQNNMKTGGMSNDALADLAYMHNHGQLMDVNKIAHSVSNPAPYQSNQELLKAVQQLDKTTKANKPIEEGFIFDEVEKALIHWMKKDGNIRRTHRKSSGLWGG